MARKTYTEEEINKQKETARNLRKKKKPLTTIAKVMKLSLGTVRSRLGIKKESTGSKSTSEIKSKSKRAPKAKVTLNANNPIAQVAVAHERLMQVNKDIEVLLKEKADLENKMRSMMEKATAVCPGLKGMSQHQSEGKGSKK